jgi:hypothetical protein
MRQGALIRYAHADIQDMIVFFIISLFYLLPRALAISPRCVVDTLINVIRLYFKIHSVANYKSMDFACDKNINRQL